MKKKISISVLLFATTIFLCGCPYESDFPLAMPENAQIDRNLIGNWRFIQPENEKAATLAIYPFNDHEFIFIILEADTKISVYRAFVTSINGENFLNVQEIDRSVNKRHWFFVNYSITSNRLTLRILEDTLTKNEKIDTPQALSGFIGKNLKEKDLYGEGSEMVFERLLNTSGS